MQVLIVVILCLLYTAAAKTIKLEVLAYSNSYYLAVIPIDGVSYTSRIEIAEAVAPSGAWLTMQINNGGFWELNAPDANIGFRFPLSVRLTATNGATVIVPSVLSSSYVPTVDLGAQYVEPNTPNDAPRPSMSTTAPIMPTTKPVECLGDMKLMVPLYTYRDTDWDLVANNAHLVKTVAIIKPNIQAPDDNYANAMQRMYDAGVELIGYVDTVYGTRSMEDVKADIDVYAMQYPLLSGIFLDKASASSTLQPYYETLFTYITAMPGWTYDVVNPGMVPDSAFNSIATQIVTFEDYGVSLTSSSVPSWANCETKDKFVALVHSVSTEDLVASVDAVLNKNYIGYVYITDGASNYNTLSAYYSTLVASLLPQAL